MTRRYSLLMNSLMTVSATPFRDEVKGNKYLYFSSYIYTEMTLVLSPRKTRTQNIMTSSNENIFRVTGHLCGEFTGPGEFPAQRPVTRNFDVFFDLRPNTRLSKQWWGWWFETPSSPLWRHCNDGKVARVTVLVNGSWSLHSTAPVTTKAVVLTTAACDLAMQGARASATVELT